MIYYRIGERDLLDLLTAAYNFWALEGGGVDNWEWAGESVHEFVESMNDENHTSFDDIEEMARHDLKSYPICRCGDEKKMSTFDDLVVSLFNE